MSRQDARLVERTVASMETLLGSGVSQVSVRHVLQLLGRDVPAESAAVPEPTPVRDPRADPMTGCLPVTAQGGAHDGDNSKEGRRLSTRGFRA